ncbi:MAG: ABC transporter substrate-binding protein [Anaerolineaceae bacterium]|nr:ABC transporter substrate-binding protein [Anaerolineaceae bacterium]
MSPKPVIKVGHLRISDHLALGVTKDKIDKGEETFNYFDLETSVYQGWNPLAQDIRAGTIDMAFILAPLAMEQFHSKGDIRLILQAHKDGSILVTNKNANIEKLEDFKGKTILIPHYLSIHHLLFDKLLRDSGLEVGAGKDVIFDVVAPSEIPEIIEWDEKGTVGGFIVAEPFGSQVIKAGYGKEFKISKEIWPKHPCCVVVAREEIVEKNPDAILEFTKSLVKSGEFIESEKDAASEIGAAFLNQKVEVIKAVLADPREKVSFGEMFPVISDYDFIQKYMTEKISAMSGKIDLEKFVDPQFAREAGAK